MPSERSLWDYVRKGMRGLWRAQRLEDRLSAGIPDVCYTVRGMKGCGFLELKYKPTWPKYKHRPFTLKHFTKEQRLWLKFIGEWAEWAFVLLQVEREYLLFDWSQAQLIGELPRSELIHQVTARWEGSICWGQFARLISC
jgi:hypothetical protein